MTSVDGYQVLKGHDRSNENYRRPLFYSRQRGHA